MGRRALAGWCLSGLCFGISGACRAHAYERPRAAAPPSKPEEHTAVALATPSRAAAPTSSASAVSSRVPYRQPFANPARNSAEPDAVAPRQAQTWKPLFVAKSMYAAATTWLLGGGGDHYVLLFDHATGHAWLVDVQNERGDAVVGAVQGSFPVYQEDADQLVMPRGGILLLPDMADPYDYDRWREAHGGLGPWVHALIARQEHFTMMSSEYDRRELHFWMEITSKPYSDNPNPRLGWAQSFKSQASAPSPALSDDTLIACREGGLTFFAPGGAGFIDPTIGIMQAKVIAEVAVALRPGLVSADLLDRVWGFRAEDGALIGWDARGQSLGPALALDVSATQPPVALPGGAIAVVAAGAVLRIEDGSVQWRAELPPSAHPLATADRDGKLLVRAGKQLVLIDEHGKRVWSSELPAEITSNPLITNTGRLCVAVGLTLYCSQ